MLLKIHATHPQHRLLIRAAQILNEGGVVAYPTDFTYGFGCELSQKKALAKIYRARNIAPGKPLSMICKDIGQASTFAYITDSAFKLMKRILPGPYTFIFRASREVPKILLGKRKEVGIRICHNPIARGLLEVMSSPILNATVVWENQNMVDPELIYDRFKREIELVIDGGTVTGEMSTVIDFTGEIPSILREGAGPIDVFTSA
jgi:tRNA threonylcarbamoyl adenosine modification protein (Sua5/YciO/YrdC/YwlC family)